MGQQGKQVIEEEEVSVRCTRCGYFVCEPILNEMVRGKLILKVVCKSCKVKLLLTFVPDSVMVAQV